MQNTKLHLPKLKTKVKQIKEKTLLVSIFYACLFSLSGNSSAQKPIKVPSKIGDAFVLEFTAPYDRILIDVDERDLPVREYTLILIGNQTKFLDRNGKPTERNIIRRGMQLEIKLEKTTDINNLIAKSVKIETDPSNEPITVKGFLDKFEDDLASIDGRTVTLQPNTIISGSDEWKNKNFNLLNDVPLGSIVELKGTRRVDGKIYISQGKARPNIFSPIEKQLIQLVQKGLVLPPPDKSGAGVLIGGKSYKVVENLELNTYITKVGSKVIPRHLKNLQDGDPNKILFRFYVLEDETPNAMALPDGSVFIHTGLLKKLDNEAQLAFILGHEIAHVTNEHPRRTLETAQKQAFWMGLAAAAAGAALGSDYGILIGQIGFGLMSNKFSREMEDQADRVGLFYAYDAGYDVRETEKIWRKLMGDSYNESKVGIFLYSDHPSLMSRMRDVKRILILDYQNADFREVVNGREKYLETVGVYFGWVQPKPIPVKPPTAVSKSAAKNTVKSKKSNLPIKQTKPVQVNDGFAAFFASFKKAVLSNSRNSVRNLMADNFEWALDGYVMRDEALKYMDDMKLWAGLRNAVLRKPVICKSPFCNNRAGYRTWSIARYKVEIMFEKDAAGKWHWTAMLGD